MNHRGRGQEDRDATADLETHRHTRSRLAVATPHELQVPAGSGMRGGASRMGTFATGRERSARWDPHCGVGFPALEDGVFSSPQAGFLIGPPRKGLRGRAWWVGAWARHLEGRRGRLPDVSYVAWSQLPFPGGRSSPNPEAGLSLLGALGLLVSWRSLGRAWVLLILGCRSRCSGSCVWPLSAPCAPGISITWQCQVRLRGC